MKKKTFSGWTWITLACFLFFAVFFIYPISRIFLNSVYDFNTGTFSLKAFEKFFGKKYYTNTIWNIDRTRTSHLIHRDSIYFSDIEEFICNFCNS